MNLLISLIAPAVIIIFAAIIFFAAKMHKENFSDFDVEFEALKSSINVCNDYSTLRQYKVVLHDLMLKYDDCQFAEKECMKLNRRLHQKILNAPK